MKILLVMVATVFSATSALGQQATLLPDDVVATLAEEVSGESAKRNLEELSRQHRMRGSEGYSAASQHIVRQLKAYGLDDAHIESFPADGKIFYGPQRSRPAWDAEMAELWEIRSETDHLRLANWEAMPLTLAQDSESADVVADLVDVGNGTSDADYEGKDVRGRIVLAAQQPGPVAKLAVDKYGAVGIVSYAQNQRTAWWKDDGNLIRWGHLDTFSPTKTFAFMVTLDRARAFQRRLAAGERIQLHAIVKAERHAGAYEVATATIEGVDPKLRDEEIVFSCHLDHPRPGANDNASGCSAILEIARSIAKLLTEEKLSRPARTIRFVWPAEIEGTHAFLNGRPDIARRIKAAIHLDMVGGGPETKAINHITRGPASLPSFVNDVAENFAAWVNAQSEEFAKTQAADQPFVAPEGGKEPFMARFVPFTQGSDHQVYTDSSWGIPAIYMNQWPDRYIHTNFDVPSNIDPTVLKRFAFVGAASGYFLANASTTDSERIASTIQRGSLRRTADMLENADGLADDERTNLVRFHLGYERAFYDSMQRFFEVPKSTTEATDKQIALLASLVGASAASRDATAEGKVYRRNPKLRGPLTTFGYDYLDDHYGADRTAALGLLGFKGIRGGGGDYAYEVLNFVDGNRDVRQIRDDVSAIYGPVPVALVDEYLTALAAAGVIEP